MSVQSRDLIEPDNGSEPNFDGITLPILSFGNDLRLRRFTKQAAEKLQLRESDIGSQISILNLKIPALDGFAAQVLQTRKMLETEIQCQDGHWYLVRIEPLLTAAELSDGVVIVLIDIDRSKRTERELGRLNETLRALFQSAPDAVVTVDPQGSHHARQ